MKDGCENCDYEKIRGRKSRCGGDDSMNLCRGFFENIIWWICWYVISFATVSDVQTAKNSFLVHRIGVKKASLLHSPPPSSWWYDWVTTKDQDHLIVSGVWDRLLWQQHAANPPMATGTLLQYQHLGRPFWVLHGCQTDVTRVKQKHIQESLNPKTRLF